MKNKGLMYYIAYGSNTPQEMMERCPGATFLGKVKAPLKLLFNYYATVVPSDEDTIEVMLYSITKEDKKKLDIYEGYPDLYKKALVQTDFKGEKIYAMTYFMPYAKEGYFRGMLPDGDYLVRCARGYKEAGIPIEQLENAVMYSVHRLLEDS